MANLNLLPEDTKNYTSAVLKSLYTGAVIGASVIAPNMLQLLAGQLSSDRNKLKTLRALRYAKSKGWLTFRDVDEGQVEVALTESGKLKWLRFSLNEPLHEKIWDGKWRLVIFDIPVSKHDASRAFRDAIKRLGFQLFQKSIWVSPYSCQKEVIYLRQEYGLRKYIRIVEAIAIDNENELLEKFKLSPTKFKKS